MRHDELPHAWGLESRRLERLEQSSLHGLVPCGECRLPPGGRHQPIPDDYIPRADSLIDDEVDKLSGALEARAERLQ
jgi:hypothetical protein